MKMLKNIPPFLRNKFFLASLFFIIWLSFFDKNDLYSQFSYRKDLKKLEDDKAYYLKEISKNKEDMRQLMSDPQHLEKYAREHYLMKKPNEDIFLILPDTLKGSVSYSEQN